MVGWQAQTIPGVHMKILIVDDSVVMRRIMINTLSQSGVQEIEQAADGAEGVSKVLEDNFDIVLMDYNMPNLNGMDAVRQIRSMGSRVPIIMVTTEAEKDRIVEALKAGADNYIVKPFSPRIILSKIRSVIGNRAA